MNFVTWTNYRGGRSIGVPGSRWYLYKCHYSQPYLFVEVPLWENWRVKTVEALLDYSREDIPYVGTLSLDEVLKEFPDLFVHLL